MASIALGAAGSAVGGALGGAVLGIGAATIGQAAGAYVGSFIDSSLFASKTKLPDVIGQRLETLSVQVSTYGKTIPHVYGYARLAGNVIWARNIREEEVRTTTTSSGGGKGGGGGSVSQTSVSYRYYATLAIAISEGQIDDVVRVWADAKQLTSEELQANQGKYEIFYGAEEQNPSAIIERYDGAGNVPCWAFWKRLRPHYGGPKKLWSHKRVFKRSGGLTRMVLSWKNRLWDHNFPGPIL